METLAENKKKMEAEGMKKVEELKKNNNVTQESTLKVVSDGCDEFKKEYGRNMTYSEMRERYG
uniref:Uncharacterized protein n=1 Tax=viral metagenome TaxID=1070528 RepID=A0A6C0BUV4_9ZZZZ